jgi:hypothetical protein
VHRDSFSWIAPMSGNELSVVGRHSKVTNADGSSALGIVGKFWPYLQKKSQG